MQAQARALVQMRAKRPKLALQRAPPAWTPRESGSLLLRVRVRVERQVAGRELPPPRSLP